MENKFFKMLGLEGLLESAQGYIDSKVQLVKLEIQEKLTNIITLLLLLIAIIFLSFITLAFFSMAFAYFLNSLLDSNYLGFIILGFLYFALIVLVILSKNAIHKKIQKITGHFMDINNNK